MRNSLANARAQLDALEKELSAPRPRVTESLEAWSLCKYHIDQAVTKTFRGKEEPAHRDNAP